MKRPLLVTGLVAMLATATSGAWAADHVDSPAAVSDPSADITDVYAWMESDASKMNLVMNVFPFADMTAGFSTSAVYTFHLINVDSSANQIPHDVRCTFASNSSVQCWVVDGSGTVQDYVTGDPTNSAGLDSDSGMVKVFAGLRNDPFFFNLDGFNDAIDTVKASAGGLTFNAEGCPDVNSTISTTLVGMLGGTSLGTMPAADKFAGANVLSLVVQIDKSLVSADGPLVNLWAATNAAGS